MGACGMWHVAYVVVVVVRGAGCKVRLLLGESLPRRASVCCALDGLWLWHMAYLTIGNSN
eukprot:scaffold28678_cov111-Isochrysis_galbana.AAC.2